MKKSTLKYILICGLVNLFMPFGRAQQEYQLSNAYFNPFLLNPAAGGLTDVIQMDLTARTQWTGYEGGPKTMLVSVSSQVGKFNSEKPLLVPFGDGNKTLFQAPEVSITKKKHVVGGKVWTDAVGVFTKTAVQFSYARHLILTQKLNLGAGLGLGYSNFRVNASKVVLFQNEDNLYDQFLSNTAMQNFLDAQLGLVVYGKNLFVGYSATQLFKNTMQWQNVETDSRYERHHFLIMKYRMELTPQLTLEPMGVIKMVKKSPVSCDLGARFIYNNSSWVGLQFRTSNSLAFQLGSNLVKGLYASYSFEMGVGKIRTASNGTHELHLGYFLGSRKKVDNPKDELEDGN
jgi:type IX secretion system PorP/SprF family membrane protein